MRRLIIITFLAIGIPFVAMMAWYEITVPVEIRFR